MDFPSSGSQLIGQTQKLLPETVNELIHRLGQELSCPICLNIINDAASTPCNHLFCRECVETSLKHGSKAGGSGTCPICKNQITKRSLNQSPKTTRLVELFENLAQVYKETTGKHWNDSIIVDEFNYDKENQPIPPPSHVHTHSSYNYGGQHGQHRSAHAPQIIPNFGPGSRVWSQGTSKTQSRLESLSLVSMLSQSTRTCSQDNRYSIDQLEALNNQIDAEISAIDQQLNEEVDQQKLLDLPLPSSPTPYSCQLVNTNSSYQFSDTQPLFSSLEPTIDQAATLETRLSKASSILFTTSLIRDPKHHSWIKAFLRRFRNVHMTTEYNGNYKSTKVTHVITVSKNTNEGMRTRRTLKTMLAILDGKWLVSIDWVNECLKENRLVTEEPFEICGDEYNQDSGAKRSRLSRNLGEAPLLTGISVYLYGKFGQPGICDILLLLKHAGATIIPDIDKLARLFGKRIGDRRRNRIIVESEEKEGDGGKGSSGSHGEKVLIICDPREQTSFEKDADTIVKFRPLLATSWLLESISSFQLVDPCRHIVL